jgi:hypothetical protein
MLRFLRASRWDADHAIHRLETTLKWRRSFGLHSFITPDFVEPEVCLSRRACLLSILTETFHLGGYWENRSLWLR